AARPVAPAPALGTRRCRGAAAAWGGALHLAPATDVGRACRVPAQRAVGDDDAVDHRGVGGGHVHPDAAALGAGGIDAVLARRGAGTGLSAAIRRQPADRPPLRAADRPLLLLDDLVPRRVLAAGPDDDAGGGSPDPLQAPRADRGVDQS